MPTTGLNPKCSGTAANELCEVIWGGGYELYHVDDDADNPVFIGRFGYDDGRPKAYLDDTVVGVACIDGKLEATVRNPLPESC